MIIVKKSVLLVLPLLFLSFFFSSCGKANSHKEISEVDLNSKLPVQLEYRQFIYKCDILFKGDALLLDFNDNGDFPDGFSYKCDGAECILSYEGLEKSYPCSALPPDYLPVVLQQFFGGFGTSVTTEGYDDTKGCSYIKRTVNDSFVTFEVYNQGDRSAYNIVIN